MLNPGSTTLPKENHPNSYGVIDYDSFKVKTFDGKVYKEINLK